MNFRNRNLVNSVLFLSLLMMSQCINNHHKMNRSNELLISLDSVHIIKSKSDSSSQITAILYYYFTCTNKNRNSTIYLQIEKFKDYIGAKDSLIIYYQNMPTKLYTSFRKDRFELKYMIPCNLTLSPDPNDLFTLLKKPTIDRKQKFSDYVNNASIILYLSNDGKVDTIHARKSKFFIIKTIDSDDPWF